MTGLPRLACLLLVLTLGHGPALAQGDPVDASRGRWTGAVAERTPGAPGTGRVELRFDGTAERFNLELGSAGNRVLAGDFQRGERKDLYGPPAPKGVRALLGRSATVKPLEGEPLAWARRNGSELVVYRLELRDGVHRLDRLLLVPAGPRMRLEFERREHDKPPQRFTATLERGAS